MQIISVSKLVALGLLVAPLASALLEPTSGSQEVAEKRYVVSYIVAILKMAQS